MSGHGFRDRNGCKAQQLRGGYHAPRSCFYPVALTEGAGVLTTQNAKDKGVVLAASVSYFLNGHLGVPDQVSAIGEDKFRSHVPNSGTWSQKVNRTIDDPLGSLPQNRSMPRYKYRDAFDDAYWNLREERAWSDADVAAAIGKSPHMLACYRRKGETGSVPPEDVVRAFASLCGVSPFRFMDDPRVADAFGNETWSALPEWQRDLLQRNCRVFDGTTLPPEQWQLLMDRLAADARAMEALFRSASREK